jgi:4-amino-4-deoxy-L-arabinose transferase-like glycosyltransferase
MEKKRIIKELLLIFLFALILRIIFILTLNNAVDVWGDWWDELGVKIATGQGFWVDNPYFPGAKPFYSWRPPGFPLFLAGIYKVFGHSYLYAKIGLAVLSALSCVLLFFIASDLLNNKKAGIWCSIIYAVYPPSIFWTGYLSPVTMEIFLLLLTVLLLHISEKKQSYLLLVLAGISTGLGILTRSVFLVLIFLVPVWLALKGKKILLRRIAIYTIITLVTILPWLIRNYKTHKTFVLTSTEGGIVCYIANNEEALFTPTGYLDPIKIENTHIIKEIRGLSEVQIDKYFYMTALKFIKENPKMYCRLVIDRFFRFWRMSPHTFSGPGESYKSYHVVISLLTNIPIFILAGLGFLISIHRWRDFSLFYLLIFFWSIPIILFFKTIIRYREPLIPLVIVMAWLTLHSLLYRDRSEEIT